MKERREGRLRLLFASIALTALAINFTDSALAQSRSRVKAVSRGPRVPVLRNINQLKEVFERDRGKVRLIALLSPT
jgi:hypothetical protein